VPGIDFHRLRAEITIERVLRQLGFQPAARSGDQLRGPCPVHGSSSPGSRTFSVNLTSGRYYCHKCQSHGNLLELWAAIHHLPIYEAALDLCQALGHPIPWMTRCGDRRNRREEAPVPKPPLK
jgi:DNA primase